jgi:hypothetical protein
LEETHDALNFLLGAFEAHRAPAMRQAHLGKELPHDRKIPIELPQDSRGFLS